MKIKNLLLFSLIFLLIASCGKKEENDIKVGIIIPLTGPAAQYGVALKNGLELAKEEINNAGGIKGKQLNLIYEDDKGQTSVGVSAFKKLVEIDNVNAIIGGAMSSVANALIPIVKEKKIILISPTATDPSLSGTSKYFFRIWPSDNYDGKVMATVAKDSLDLNKVATLYINLDYGKGINDVFVKIFQELGGKIVTEETYNQGATNFRTELQKIKKLNPDGLFLPGYYQEIAGILKQARELNFKTTFLGVNSFYDPKLLEIAGASAEGAVFSYPTYDENSTDPAIKNFVSNFERRYGNKPDVFAVQGYDALKVLAEGISYAEQITADEIVEGLKKVDYEGPGGYIRFLQNGDTEKPLRILIVKNKSFAPFNK